MLTVIQKMCVEMHLVRKLDPLILKMSQKDCWLRLNGRLSRETFPYQSPCVLINGSFLKWHCLPGSTSIICQYGTSVEMFLCSTACQSQWGGANKQLIILSFYRSLSVRDWRDVRLLLSRTHSKDAVGLSLMLTAFLAKVLHLFQMVCGLQILKP